MPSTAAPSPLTRLSYSETARIIERAIAELISTEVGVTIDRITFGRFAYSSSREGTEPALIFALIGEGVKPTADVEFLERLQEVPAAAMSVVLSRHFSDSADVPISCSITKMAFRSHGNRGAGLLQFRAEVVS